MNPPERCDTGNPLRSPERSPARTRPPPPAERCPDGYDLVSWLEWGDEIFAFHTTDRVSNGRIEGTNNKLGVLKRIAYGFVSATNFGHRALLLTPGVAT